MFNSKIVAAAGLLAVANGHMLMTNPKPYDFYAKDTVVNRPLDGTGSDFPCRQTGSDWSGPTNSYPLGSKQTLSLVGSAVHGGGSCQIAITYDTAPTKSSKWKVIHSIQGGCPARNTVGNLAANSATAPDPDTYDFTIPSDIPAGKGVIAWSWLNRVGNREFYMNCGNVELTGTGGTQSNFDALPDLFVANLDSVNKCTTNGFDGMDILIPNPGKSVETNSMVNAQPLTNAACKAAAGSGGSGSGSESGGSAAPAPTSAQVSSPVASAPAASSSAPGGVFITQTTAAQSSATQTSAAVPQASSVAPAPVPSASSGSSGALTGPCTQSGLFNCIGGTAFQQCASGQWSAVTQMAAGTSCTAGQSTDMKIAAAGHRMAVRALRA